MIFKPDGTHELLPEGPPIGLADKLHAIAETFPPAKFAAAN